MKDERGVQQVEEREHQSFLQRLEVFQLLFLAAHKVALAKFNDERAGYDVWKTVHEEMRAIRQGSDFDEAQFDGDVVSGCLRGYFREPNPAVEAELAKIGDPDTIRQKHLGPFDDLAQSVKAQIYEAEIRRDRLIDKIDLGPSMASVILDSNKYKQGYQPNIVRLAKYHVLYFQVLRSAAGVTRSGLYRDGDEVLLDMRLCRRKQTSVRRLLELVGEPESKTVATQPDIQPGMEEYYKAVQRDQTKRAFGKVASAIAFWKSWLSGKEVKTDDSELREEFEKSLADFRQLELELLAAREAAEGALNAVVRKIREQQVSRLEGRYNDLKRDVEKLERKIRQYEERSETKAAKERGDGSGESGASVRQTLEAAIAEVKKKVAAEEKTAADLEPDVMSKNATIRAAGQRALDATNKELAKLRDELVEKQQQLDQVLAAGSVTAKEEPKLPPEGEGGGLGTSEVGLPAGSPTSTETEISPAPAPDPAEADATESRQRRGTRGRRGGKAKKGDSAEAEPSA